MKIKFSKSVTFIPSWRKNNELPAEEQVSVILKPMKVTHLLDLLDAYGGRAEGDKVEAKVVAKIVDAVGDCLPEYVEVHNLHNEESGPVSIAEMIEYPYYLDLVAEITMQLASISMPSEMTAKN